MYDSFVRYQTRLIRVFDRLAQPYGFTTVDASRPPDQVFEALRAEISRTFAPAAVLQRGAFARSLADHLSGTPSTAKPFSFICWAEFFTRPSTTVATMHLVKEGTKSVNKEATVITAEMISATLTAEANRSLIVTLFWSGATSVPHRKHLVSSFCIVPWQVTHLCHDPA